jgi:hypothetical protein
MVCMLLPPLPREANELAFTSMKWIEGLHISERFACFFTSPI